MILLSCLLTIISLQIRNQSPESWPRGAKTTPLGFSYAELEPRMGSWEVVTIPRC
jgi:hypothetical protein